MSKTNHQRGFYGQRETTRWIGFRKNRICMDGKVLFASNSPVPMAKGFGMPDGPNEARKMNRGEKKYVRSRTRFKENQAVRKLQTEY